ncbi:MAG: hypothetical protein IKC94_00920 [Lentisphaeria bacterium]|nr:hypothetical protein [Lentisphaeria bacterium]
MWKMKKSILVWLIVLAALPVSGQLSVSLRFNRSVYMTHEQVYACITIRNDSGRPLLFGERPELQGFILFDIRDQNNRLIQRIPGAELQAKGLYIAPGEIKNVVVPLHRYYNLKRAGTYQVHVYISHNNLPREFRSRNAILRISNGAVVWRKEVGLPRDSGNDDGPAVSRVYSILKLETNREKFYYLRVEDNGRIYAVTRIGQVLAYMEYEVQVDMLSRIHLLMPVAPRIFHYMSFNADGIIQENSYWKTSGTIPMLHRDPRTGVVSRMGGAPARKGVDYDDPVSGQETVSDLLGGSRTPRRDSGIVDLGEGVMPTQPADVE